MKEFDEKEAVKAMRQTLPPEASSRCNDDELLNIIDIIWDWYEDQGLLDIDAEADDDDVNVDALVAHVRKMIAKDKLSPIHPDEIEPIVAAELQYEQSLI
ncbi:hypothetical protein [Duncaniella freteri]|uniref:hypothetical protein n=1 Tax=Duncaniella freteri TaxID=2530391 RepID=UPI0023C6439F|nr:hypothetical protein [Duncaniella freteri]MDE7028100.1 hypothetical protein [Duncaniella freteri]